jgi:hypothetical protein
VNTRSTIDLAVLWDELVTVALLGTDRRDPPRPPDGLLADVVADAVRPTPSQRMLVTVAACAVARRAGVRPGPAAPPLLPPAPDPRPTCSEAAARTWRHLVSTWPVLEDEWLTTIVERGWRLPADLTVELLVRHRADQVRRVRAVRAAGPVAEWLVDHVPELAPARHGGGAATVPAGSVDSLPPLAVPPELAELLTVDAHTFVTRLVPDLAAGRYGPPHRAVLVNLVARCRPEVLEPAATAIADIAERSPAAVLATALADLAATRHRMLTELAGPLRRRGREHP